MKKIITIVAAAFAMTQAQAFPVAAAHVSVAHPVAIHTVPKPVVIAHTATNVAKPAVTVPVRPVVVPIVTHTSPAAQCDKQKQKDCK